jgi:hypothetical protein
MKIVESMNLKNAERELETEIRIPAKRSSGTPESFMNNAGE